jgi:hemerythrin-like domain-containing protein
MHVSVRRLIEKGFQIINNLLQHILAEDTVYFEVAESGFSAEELEEMGREMNKLEARLKEQDFEPYSG